MSLISHQKFLSVSIVPNKIVQDYRIIIANIIYMTLISKMLTQKLKGMIMHTQYKKISIIALSPVNPCINAQLLIKINPTHPYIESDLIAAADHEPSQPIRRQYSLQDSLDSDA